MTKRTTVIFDLGGVLIDWNPDYVYKTIFEKPEELKWFYENICTADWNEEQDAGRSLQAATEELITKFPDHEANIRVYYDRWEDMLGGPIQGTVDILKELKNSVQLRLYALTNWSAETFPIALKRYEFLHWFDGRLVSGEEKTRKPFADIYDKLISRFDINPLEAVYIDDNQRNLAPAKSLGMHTIHFTTPDNLRQELNDLNLL
jgi:2-haloacid dehalogenase